MPRDPDRDGEAATLVARARGTGPGTVELRRCLQRLADAVTEFDAALDQSLALPGLVDRDREVAAAERACLRAATDAVAGHVAGGWDPS